MGTQSRTSKENSKTTYELRRTIRSLPAEALTLSWRSDGSVLAVGDQFGIIRLMNRKEGAVISRIEAHSVAINSLSWSPDGTKLSSGSDDGTVRIWNTENEEKPEPIQTIPVTKNKAVTEVSWSPENEYLAVASGEGTVRVWGFQSGMWLSQLPWNTDFAAHLSWSVDASLVFARPNGEIGMWRVGGSPRNIEEYDFYLIGPSWAPNSNRIAAGTLNGEICIWNSGRRSLEDTFSIGGSYVLRTSWSPTVDHVLVECQNGSVLVFDVEKGEVIKHLNEAIGSRCNPVWSPDGTSLAFGGDRGVIHIYDLSLMEIVTSMRILGKWDLREDWAGSSVRFSSIAWGKDGAFAANLDGQTISIVKGDDAPFMLGKISAEPLSVPMWSPDGQVLAIAGEGRVFLWHVRESRLHRTFAIGDIHPTALCWSPDGTLLAAGTSSGDVVLMSLRDDRIHRVSFAEGRINLLSWRPDGGELAVYVMEDAIYLWDSESQSEAIELYSSTALMTTMAWSPDGKTLASGDEAGVVFLYEKDRRRRLRTLEGHAGPILSVAWAPNGRALASASDDSVKVWRRQNWDVAEMFQRVPAGRSVETVSFHRPTSTRRPHVEGIQIDARIFELEALFAKPRAVTAVNYTSAKVVLVGESNVGKSCLGLRLAQNRYEEQGTTHGMRTWSVSPQQIDSRFKVIADEERDITLWDMGGQDEYRLIHQLFLHDTTLALIMFDPTRGRTSFGEVEEWSLRLEKQLEGRRATKLLVGTKMDGDSSLVDRLAIQRLITKCRFVDFFETSAKTSRGLEGLGKAIVKAIDWSNLSKTTRLALFQRIRDKIEFKSGQGHVVMLYSDLEDEIRNEEADYTADAMNVVVRQLALQGLIVDTRLASGERALVFQVGEVERYAGSLIVEARNNPRGIPAIEARRIATFKLFPGISQDERLPPFQERIVVECVMQLLIERNICLVHEGLLIFPSLFKETEREQLDHTPPSASIYYDFSGAIDSIYTTLIVRLSLSDGFGRVRMWMDGAEFERAGLGTCEIKKKSTGGGLAHLDLIFSEEVPAEQRNLFVLFVEDHLRKEGVQIAEGLNVTCKGCGQVTFEEWILRTRLSEGKVDITCHRCDTANRIIEGAQIHRESDPDLVRKLIALRTDATLKTGRIVAEIKNAFEIKDDSKGRAHASSAFINLLHLSDIHLMADDDAFRMLQPLVRDLEDEKNGFGLNCLDYLVISGDLTNRGTPQEYEKAYQFISELTNRFQLTTHRCIIVPGNHDQDWETKNLYRWTRKRDVNVANLRRGNYIPLGADYGMRDERNYNKRFQAFSKFYHSLVQEEYPLRPEDQCLSFLFPETKLQFLAFNSAWQIDEFFPERSSINDSALSKGLLKADHDLRVAIETGELSTADRVLRIGVWHHPASGGDRIEDDSYLERLQAADVRLCLTGHIHEERADVMYHLEPARSIHSIGAGSVGAVGKNRPPSTPRLYNLLQINRDLKSARVNTRARRKDDGKWSGWNVWPSPHKGEGRAYYDIHW